MIYYPGLRKTQYEVIRMSEGASVPTHERLARIKEKYWGRDWDVARMLAAANRIYVETPSESESNSDE